MIWIYLSLFASAFLSATLLPGSSEVVLSGLVVKQQGLLWLLWLSATVGNVLGSCVNYWLGLKMMSFQDRRWFPIKAEQIAKGQRVFDKYGVYSLLFAWLPVVGDPLTLLGGVFKVRLSLFVLLVSIGKALRYGFIIAVALGIERLI
ncbi:YqaA family protein [Pseudoalteromonas phenolica]|uniref:YqaA family protein n=1 Tax=Pseudoalteromonas phenolica TaxID=161398 RepID=UPI002016567C|nr:YqaA family protein [Pseudoalteromonas phenolica]